MLTRTDRIRYSADKTRKFYIERERFTEFHHSWFCVGIMKFTISSFHLSIRLLLQSLQHWKRGNENATCFEVLNESGTYAPKSGSGSEVVYVSSIIYQVDRTKG